MRIAIGQLMERHLDYATKTAVRLALQREELGAFLVEAVSDLLLIGPLHPGNSPLDRRDTHGARPLFVETLDLRIQVGDRLIRVRGHGED